MNLTIGDIIRITLCQRLSNQEVCMVFAYVVDAVTGDVTIGELLDFFITDVLTDINDVQSASVVNDRAIAENLTNGIDFVEVGLTGNGDGPSLSVPTFSALSFKYFRQNKLTRNGFKRIPGPRSELDTGPNVWDTSNSVVGILATRFETALTPDGATPPDNASATPIILGRQPDGKPDLSRFQRVQNVEAQENKTTQNSRKIGTGV